MGNFTDTNVQVILSCPEAPSTCKGLNVKESRTVVTLKYGIRVMCDTETDGGGWIIFQRRIIGNISFYRGWEDYRYGFGDYDIGEFYLGNEYIHQLTSKRRYEMRVDMRFNNKKYFARYSQFRILGELENYRLQVSGYSGNATDNFISHSNSMFSTFDKDNDGWRDNCAKHFLGGWWYFDGCHHSNLNGIWGSTTSGQGIIWYGVTTHHASLTYSEMKIREIDYLSI